MPADLYDDEDWFDDERDDEPDDGETGCCPECGRPIHRVADKCPACGYWLSAADRREMWSGQSQPLWLKVTATLLLIAVLIWLLTTVASVL